RFQPAPDQTDQAWITDPMRDEPEHPIMIETPEEVLEIRLQHPAHLAAGDDLIEGRQSMMSAELWPATEGAGQKVLLINGRQHFGRAALERPVGDSRHAKWPLFRLAGFGDIDPPDIRRSISLAVNGLEHRLYPSIEALLRRLHRLSIHPSGRPLRNLQQILPHPIARDVMSQRRVAEFRFASSFRLLPRFLRPACNQRDACEQGRSIRF